MLKLELFVFKYRSKLAIKDDVKDWLHIIVIAHVQLLRGNFFP